MKDALVKSIVVDTLGTVDKGREKRIVIRLMEIDSYRYLDIRTFFLVNGGWNATGKGITLSGKNFDSFLGLLNQKQELLADGLNPMTPEEFAQRMCGSKPKGQKIKKKQHEEKPVKVQLDNKQKEFDFNERREVQNGSMGQGD